MNRQQAYVFNVFKIKDFDRNVGLRPQIICVIQSCFFSPRRCFNSYRIIGTSMELDRPRVSISI